MNTIVFALVAAVTVSAIVPDDTDPAQYRRTGGQLVKRGTYTGKIALVNAAGDAQRADVERAAALLKAAIGVNIAATVGKEKDPAAALKASGADAAVVVVDSPDAPEILLAPNDRWAVVNVAKIVDDLPSAKAKDRFRAPRVRKQIIKAFCALMGGSASQYEGNIMNTTSTRELDLVEEQFPVDVVDKVQKQCRHLGITQAEYVSYKTACRQGWAPQPTNDVQKAIWDKIHAMPTAPIKIKPE